MNAFGAPDQIPRIVRGDAFGAPEDLGELGYATDEDLLQKYDLIWWADPSQVVLDTGPSGAAATMSAPASGKVTVTGLAGCHPQMVGETLTLANGESENSGTFQISDYVDATSVKVWNPAGTGGDPNNGSIAWTTSAQRASACIERVSGSTAVFAQATATKRPFVKRAGPKLAPALYGDKGLNAGFSPGLAADNTKFAPGPVATASHTLAFVLDLQAADIAATRCDLFWWTQGSGYHGFGLDWNAKWGAVVLAGATSCSCGTPATGLQVIEFSSLDAAPDTLTVYRNGVLLGSESANYAGTVAPLTTANQLFLGANSYSPVGPVYEALMCRGVWSAAKRAAYVRRCFRKFGVVPP